MTHGPPLNIRDLHEQQDKYRGDESLRHHVAMAKPLLHVFGHSHGGYGVTLVEWKAVLDVGPHTGEWRPKGDPKHEPKRDEQEAGRKDLMTLEDLDNKDLLSEILAKGYFRTGHGTTDKHAVKKDKNTLFVNACYSPCSKDDARHQQMLIIVELDLPTANNPDVTGDKTGVTAVPRPCRTTPCCAAHGTDTSGPESQGFGDERKPASMWCPKEESPRGDVNLTTTDYKVDNKGPGTAEAPRSNGKPSSSKSKGSILARDERGALTRSASSRKGYVQPLYGLTAGEEEATGGPSSGTALRARLQDSVVDGSWRSLARGSSSAGASSPAAAGMNNSTRSLTGGAPGRYQPLHHRQREAIQGRPGAPVTSPPSPPRSSARQRDARRVNSNYNFNNGTDRSIDSEKSWRRDA